MIASTIANVNRDSKKHRKPFEPQDFMPQRRPAAPPRVMTAEESVNYIAQLNAIFGGEDLRVAA